MNFSLLKIFCSTQNNENFLCEYYLPTVSYIASIWNRRKYYYMKISNKIFTNENNTNYGTYMILPKEWFPYRFWEVCKNEHSEFSRCPILPMQRGAWTSEDRVSSSRLSHVSLCAPPKDGLHCLLWIPLHKHAHSPSQCHHIMERSWFEVRVIFPPNFFKA